jgi:hypothetical protein
LGRFSARARVRGISERSGIKTFLKKVYVESFSQKKRFQVFLDFLVLSRRGLFLSDGSSKHLKKRVVKQPG